MTLSARRVATVSAVVALLSIAGLILIWSTPVRSETQVVMATPSSDLVALPNSYEWVRTDSTTMVIYGPPSARLPATNQVGPSVSKIAIFGKFVIGRIEASGSVVPTLNRPGYFVLDTANNSIIEGLDEEGLATAARELRIPWSPR